MPDDPLPPEPGPDIFQELGIEDTSPPTNAPTPKPPETPPAASPKEPTAEAKVKFTEPAPAEGTKPVEGAKPVEGDPDPAGGGDDQKLNFKQLREAKSEAEKRATAIEQAKLTLEAELAGVQKAFDTHKSQFSEDTLKDLNTKVKEYENRLRALSVEDAPEVQAAKTSLTAVAENASNALKALAPDAAADVDHILTLPKAVRDKQIADLLKDREVDTPSLTALYVGLSDVDKARGGIELAKQQATSTAGDYAAAQEQQVLAQQEAQRTEQTAILGEVLQAAVHPDTGLAEFREIEGDEAHNAAVKERMANVRTTLMGEIDFQTAAVTAVFAEKGRAAVKAEAAYQHTIAALTAQVDAYKKQVGELAGSEPGGSGSDNADPTPGPEMDFTKAVLGDMRESGFPVVP